MADSSELEIQIADRRREISTDRYGMSIGELTSLYTDGDLIVHPEFQRFFRWDDIQKSRLIESILLGIPLPSIFVAASEGGEWELVDGLQRVSTLLQLQGLLVKDDGKKAERLILQGTKYLPALEGKFWPTSAEEERDPSALGAPQRRDIKRARIDVQIIKRDSSSDTKYDLFQRLNSYGSQLTTQELRSCMLVSVDPDFLKWVESLASSESFRRSVQLSERLIDEQYDIELVLRFLVLHNESDIKARDLKNFSSYLDDKTIEMAGQYVEKREELNRAFNTTFELISASCGENAFRRWLPGERRFTGSFLNTSYEVIALGLGFHVAQGSEFRADVESVVKEFWESPDMTTSFATGVSTETRMSRFLPRGRALFDVGASRE
ncbi:hypothetical protein A5630_07880 [Mycolicibacterium mucogenicum]|uniref:GmrSD restriction endonucleases N-terminal domain-containing protein n=1 Tax=Mycolicibacterium mucogenicum TaxID=56689 RepID=A0A1A3GKF5_MYCMU|nr:DUF262 domain-containing protein [Mycolicibacterium mucogenicum]OBJ36295.1 hypothetical protein A5630_07880 [Mycolicibacterium mucogenicum]